MAGGTPIDWKPPMVTWEYWAVCAKQDLLELGAEALWNLAQPELSARDCGGQAPIFHAHV